MPNSSKKKGKKKEKEIEKVKIERQRAKGPRGHQDCGVPARWEQTNLAHPTFLLRLHTAESSKNTPGKWKTGPKKGGSRLDESKPKVEQAAGSTQCLQNARLCSGPACVPWAQWPSTTTWDPQHPQHLEAESSSKQKKVLSWRYNLRSSRSNT